MAFVAVISFLALFLVVAYAIASALIDWRYGPEPDEWHPGQRPEDWWR